MPEFGLARHDRQVDKAQTLMQITAIGDLQAIEVESRAIQSGNKSVPCRTLPRQTQGCYQRLGSDIALQATLGKFFSGSCLGKFILVFTGDTGLTLPGAWHHLRKNHSMRQRPKVLDQLG